MPHGLVMDSTTDTGQLSDTAKLPAPVGKKRFFGMNASKHGMGS
jgi:hypothetical protein